MQDDKNQEQDLTPKIKERAFRIWVEEGQRQDAIGSIGNKPRQK